MKEVSHLHLHTEYSLQDSLISIELLPELIERFKIKSIAVTDHGTVDGAVKFYQAVKKTKAVPILGCEFYVVDDMKNRDNRHRYHMVALAKNRDGFTSIMRALTAANLDGFYYRPRIDWAYVADHLNDVVILTACRDGILSHPNWVDLIDLLYTKYEDDLYLEAILIKDHKPQYGVNEMVMRVQEQTGLKVAFTNDVHYVAEADWKAREVVRQINLRRVIDPNMVPEADQADIYMKSYDQMMESMRAFGWTDEAAAVAVWDEITDKCTFELEPKKVHIPVAYEEAVADPSTYLIKLCEEGFQADLKLRDDQKAHDRLEHELTEIIQLDFAEYFLLVQDLIRWAKSNGCRVGPGRGSVGGSLVAYVLGITEVNPLDYDLVFERFISPGRHDLPDIDIDFEDQERERVVEYLKQKYGERKVAYVSTFAAMKGRGSVRDVGRAFGVPLVEVDKIAKQILTRSGGDARADFTIEDTVTLFERAKDFHAKYPYVVEVAKAVEGLIKTKGVHAAGVVVDTDDLYSGEKCVLQRGKGGELVVNWDRHDLEYMGLMKIDALGLKTLNVLSRASDLIAKRTGKPVDYVSIPLDDQKVFDRFATADSVGTFQLGSAGMIQYLREFRPTNFTELYQVNALWRPGTLRSGLATDFIDLKNGKKKPEYISEQTKKILEETHGVMLFQEQVMYLLNRLGDIPWRTTDVIRKVISKSEGADKFETFRQQFLDGVKRLNSMTQEEAEKVFSLMKYFGSYGFNKSHSVEYTILGYWTMWLKVYHPLEFYCASLQRAGDKTDISELLNDANRHNILARMPSVNASGSTWLIEGDNLLRAGLDIIKGISSRIADEVVAAREKCGGKFSSFFEFIDSVPKRTVNVGKVRILLHANVFHDFMDEITRKKLLHYIEENKSLPSDLSVLAAIPDDVEVEEPMTSEIFSLEVTEDYYGNNRKFIDLLIEKFDVRKLTTVADALAEGTLPHYWYLGKFDEMKYGFRQRIDESGESRGYASDLGGVYGIFRDDTYHAYATVTGKLYHRKDKKRMVEDMAGRIALIRANKPYVTGSLFADMAYLLDDLKAGQFEDLELAGIVGDEPIDSKALAEEIKACEFCSERAGCRAPVPFARGSVGGLMIIGEAPGADEDREGKPFLGRAGQVLWDEMAKYGMLRENFHITNVQKCRPKENKITDPKVPAACGMRWLRKEIELVRPRLILSLGKTAIHFLLADKTASIMEWNGRVAWNERAGAFVVYGVHPAMVLYGAENRPLLEKSVAKLFEVLQRLLGGFEK